MVHFFLVIAAAPALTTAPTTLTAAGAPPPIAALWTAAKSSQRLHFLLRLPASSETTCHRAGAPKPTARGLLVRQGEKYGPSYDRTPMPATAENGSPCPI
ncbi:hypothetical protein BGW80DRAFT_1292669 [Lactifluus volemus]|nr:hypothetical protein BGW80DRAFT_1292669 [Lactifluus volemus]